MHGKLALIDVLMQAKPLARGSATASLKDLPTITQNSR